MVLKRLSLIALGRRQCLGFKALAGSFYLNATSVSEPASGLRCSAAPSHYYVVVSCNLLEARGGGFPGPECDRHRDPLVLPRRKSYVRRCVPFHCSRLAELSWVL